MSDKAGDMGVESTVRPLLEMKHGFSAAQGGSAAILRQGDALRLQSSSSICLQPCQCSLESHELSREVSKHTSFSEVGAIRCHDA